MLIFRIYLDLFYYSQKHKPWELSGRLSSYFIVVSYRSIELQTWLLLPPKHKFTHQTTEITNVQLYVFCQSSVELLLIYYIDLEHKYLSFFKCLTLPPSVSRLSRHCGILNISQPCRPSRPVTGIAVLFFFFYFLSASDHADNVVTGNRTWTSGSVARNSDHYTTDVPNGAKVEHIFISILERCFSPTLTFSGQSTHICEVTKVHIFVQSGI
jgi:hypothetical protein